MFESKLEDRFKKIFGVRWVKYGFPSDLKEQEVLFIEVSECRATIRDNRELAKVTGKGRMFAQLEKLTYGFFAKKIKESGGPLTADIFFYDIEENKTYFQNLTERSFSFIFLYDSQYNPDNGIISSINFSTGGDDA